jgi:hypothetical protein
MQQKILISILILAYTALCSTITTSKDSLWVSNNVAFSRDDAVIFSNHGTSAIVLDSAYIEFETLDTTGMYYVIKNDAFNMVLREVHKTTEVSSSYTEFPLSHLGKFCQ